MGGSRFDCRKCTEEDKRKRGCEGGGTLKWQCDEGVYCDKCGERFVQEEAEKYLLWKRTKEHGMPFAPLGWAEHPAWMTDIIFALDDEYNAYLARTADGDER